MKEFADWLLSNDEEVSPYPELLAFAREHENEWRSHGSTKEALANIIVRLKAENAEQGKRLRIMLEQAHDRYELASISEYTNKLDEATRSQGGLLSFINALPGHIVDSGGAIVRMAAGIMALFLGVGFLYIIYPIFDDSTLQQLRDVATARGSITFLFALGTIVAALLLVIFALFGSVDGEHARKERFDQGKQVLTVLIGILGTIVGFYFGSDVNQQQRLTLSKPELTEQNSEPGGQTGIATFVSGGTPPYTIEFDFPDESGIADWKTDKESVGLVYHSIKLPARLKSGDEVAFQLRVVDGAGAQTTAKSKLSVGGEK